MENLTDNQLILLAKNGDENALDFLMKKYKKLASKLSRSYFLVGAESEDLLQEAMIGLYKAYVSYDINSKASFATFARMCIVRNIQTAVKTANRRKNQILNQSVSLSNGINDYSEDDDEEMNLVIPSTSPTPDEVVVENENLEQIKKEIISKLSNFELKVLSLYLKGYTYTQIAQKMDLSNKSIDNALTRIKHKLNGLKQQKD